ncbi:MAG TPA: hypothetical protein PLE45_06565 [Spirochaetota bacterium]|nr:hypothetical protein [Spirochaetota bacterium]HOL56940.1 hypothetical protein [Spirochaetota bacterium]HPP04484.1 hypothetical protein [Spirochaetota bacterium]
MNNKRSNYLIDKPFQIGFIVKYLLVIIFTVILCFIIAAGWFYYKSLFGDNILNQRVTIKEKRERTWEGNKIYNYDKDQIVVYEFYDSKTKQKVYKKLDERIKMGLIKDADGEVVENVDTAALEKTSIPMEKNTNIFAIVIPPLLFVCLALMIIISIYSLFFSHKMAGPIYRMRVSLDRMLAGDLDFKIRVRKTDFFINIVEKLEQLRLKIKNNDFPKSSKE